MSTSQPRRILLTGPPGSGKTTIVMRAARRLAEYGCRIDGIIAPERRRAGRRFGFDLCTLDESSCWPLARLGCPSPRRVGRYGVCIDDASRAAEHLLGSLENADVIVIDEIGPMELVVPRLRIAILEVLRSEKPLIGVIHRRLKSRDPEAYSLASRGAIVLTVTVENRDRILARVLGLAEVLAREVCGGEGG